MNSTKLVSCALVVVACGQEPTETASVAESSLAATTAQTSNAQRIHDLALARGITNSVLVAGIAYAESTLAECAKDYAGLHCDGPWSSECGGPVVAGYWDGPCSAQQGGLGLFQFDSGDYAQTLADGSKTQGYDILTRDGAIQAGISFLLERVIGYDGGGFAGCSATPHMSTEADAIAWLNGATVGSASYTTFVGCVASIYNGDPSKAGYYDSSIRDTLANFGSIFGDRCAGWSDADNCGSVFGDDPSTLYSCRGGRTVARRTCLFGCSISAPGVSDVCAPPPWRGGRGGPIPP
jgi:hypothetical protein